MTAYESPTGAFNRYWYGNNNPYKFVDPDGRQVVSPQALIRALNQAVHDLTSGGSRSEPKSEPKPVVTGSGWTRPADHPYVVGREGTPVQPGNIEQGGRGEKLDNNFPAMHTLGTLHDAFVDTAVSNGIPDQLANIPSMGGAYAISVGAETVNTNVGIVNSILGTNIPKPFEHSHTQTLSEQMKPVPEKQR